MTKCVFETAALADVLKKAASIAPTRGHAFDKAPGIQITVYPENQAQFAIIQATNLDIWYKEWVPIIECDAVGETVWRVPAKISAVVASLPIGSGKTVELNDSINPKSSSSLTVKSGRMKNNWQLIGGYYPEWDTFNPDDLTPVDNFGNRIAMVEWAASTNDAEIPMNGVYMDGEYAIASDGYQMARVPLPIDAPFFEGEGTYFVIPARGVTTLIKQTGTVSVGATETQLLIMPDPSVQIRTSIYSEPYKVNGMKRVMAIEHDGHVEVAKQAILDLLQRAMLMIGNDRFPIIDVFIGKSEIAALALDQESSDLGDVLDVNGADHPRVNYIFTPRLLVNAIEKCPSDRVQIHYSKTDPKTIVHITNGGDYHAWAIPRRNRPTPAEIEAETEKNREKEAAW